MKKGVIIAAVALLATFSALTVSAQKIGYVDMQEVVTNMPEYAKADTAVTSYGQDLYEQLQSMQKEFQNNADKFIKDSTTMSEAVKEVKRGELQDQQRRIAQFQQSLRQRVGNKQQELVQPVIDKAQKAVDAVAKSKGYTWVINDTGDGSLLIVKPAGDDLTAAVKAKLGIK